MHVKQDVIIIHACQCEMCIYRKPLHATVSIPKGINCFTESSLNVATIGKMAALTSRCATTWRM